jgi:hypothetical protein
MFFGAGVQASRDMVSQCSCPLHTTSANPPWECRNLLPLLCRTGSQPGAFRAPPMIVLKLAATDFGGLAQTLLLDVCDAPKAHAAWVAADAECVPSGHRRPHTSGSARTRDGLADNCKLTDDGCFSTNEPGMFMKIKEEVKMSISHDPSGRSQEPAQTLNRGSEGCSCPRILDSSTSESAEQSENVYENKGQGQKVLGWRRRCF